MSYAEGTISENIQHYKIKIEQKTVPYNIERDTVALLLDSPGMTLGGFDFKIALISESFDIVDIIPGDFYESCGWEFFNVRKVTDNIDNKAMSVWQVVALAEMIADSVGPICFDSENEISLAEMVVEKIPSVTVSEDIISLNFIWEDCSDNTISGQSGTSLFVSSKVVEYFKNKIELKVNQFPTFTGAPSQCIRVGNINSPKRVIEFHNGGIIIDYSVEKDSVILNK